jgi:hypothetical protein
MFSQNTQISSFMKIRPVRAEFFHANRLTDEGMDMTKLIVAFRNFKKAPKNCAWYMYADAASCPRRTESLGAKKFPKHKKTNRYKLVTKANKAKSLNVRTTNQSWVTEYPSIRIKQSWATGYSSLWIKQSLVIRYSSLRIKVQWQTPEYSNQTKLSNRILKSSNQESWSNGNSVFEPNTTQSVKSALTYSDDGGWSQSWLTILDTVHLLRLPQRSRGCNCHRLQA